MFEIGNSLREARLRQQLEFPEIEQATKIRSKYLRALEEEQFDVLPGQTYVKGFLRGYAEYLGLDGQLYVDEYNSRYVTWEEEPPQAPRRSTAPRSSRNVESRGVLVALAAIAALAVIVIAAFRFSGDSADENVIPNLGPARGTANAPARTRKRPERRAAPVRRIVRLEVSAARGSCWVDVRAGSPTGRQIFTGTLVQGERRLFTSRRLWVRFGAPSNVDLAVNGRPRPLGARVPTDAIVTAGRLYPAPGSA